MQSERFKLIASIYLILIKGENILLLRRFQTGFEDGKYGLVAGHADGGATLRREMAREANEEAGIIIKPEDMRHVLTMHRWCGDHERADFFFEVASWQGEIKNMEPNKCDDLNWFPLDQIPPNTIEYIQEALRCYRAGVSYSEFGWPEK